MPAGSSRGAERRGIPSLSPTTPRSRLGAFRVRDPSRSLGMTALGPRRRSTNSWLPSPAATPTTPPATSTSTRPASTATPADASPRRSSRRRPTIRSSASSRRLRPTSGALSWRSSRARPDRSERLRAGTSARPSTPFPSRSRTPTAFPSAALRRRIPSAPGAGSWNARRQRPRGLAEGRATAPRRARAPRRRRDDVPDA